MPPVDAFDVLTPAVNLYDVMLARLVARSEIGEIKRSYVTVGDIDFATRCSQFVVSARQVYPGMPGQQQPGSIVPHGYYVPQTLELGLAYTDCWQVNAKGVLAANKEDELGRSIAVRSAVVLSELAAAYQAGEITPDCAMTAIGPAVFVGPEGGVVGVTVVVAIQIV